MTMVRKPKADTTLCRNFCKYYKPGKNEELACQGFVVAYGIIGRGKSISLARPGKMTDADAAAADILKKRVCGSCDFRLDGCDFILTNGGASPCGGFALLSHLLGSGELKPEELEMDGAKRKAKSAT